MYKNKTIIQVGSHIGNTINDPIFKDIDNTTKLILVEPVPFLFNILKNNYIKKLKDISNVVFINKAVSNFIGTIELTVPSLKNDFRKLPFWASQLASINSTHATDHIKGLITEKIKVPTTTINSIIKENKITEIELLHTDTEGHDYEILMNYDFSIKPKKIMFEHKHMDGFLKVGNRYIILIKRLKSLGYILVSRDTEDTVMVLK